MSLASRISSLATRVATEFNNIRDEQVEHIFWNKTTDTWPTADTKYTVHHWHSENDATASPPTGLGEFDIWWTA